MTAFSKRLAPKKAKGVAIITALFIMMLVAIIATAISLNLQLSINETTTVDDYSKKFHESDQFLNCEIIKLIEQAAKSPQVFSLFDYSKVEKDDFLIETIDLQSRFNLNNLTKKEWHYSFIQLLLMVDPGTNEKDAKEITEQISYWLTPIKSGESFSSPINRYYLSETTKTLPAHSLFESPTELRLIKGISAKRYQRLAPFITALPEVTPINLNTAPKELLMVLGSGLSKKISQEIIIRRKKEKGLSKANQLNDIEGFKSAQIPQSMFSFTSSYFLTSIGIGLKSMNESMIYHRLMRKTNKKKIVVSRLSQTINTL